MLSVRGGVRISKPFQPANSAGVQLGKSVASGTAPEEGVSCPVSVS